MSRDTMWKKERWLVCRYMNDVYVPGPLGWAIIVVWTALLVAIAVR